jgi:hypothetical protein
MAVVADSAPGGIGVLANLHLGPWDAVLLVVVSVMGTVIAYVHDPKKKALILALPIPFTVATLAVGRGVDSTNVSGLVLLLAFTHGVRFLHVKLRVPIVASIVISAVGYCVVGAGLARVLPVSDAAFWWAAAVTVVVAVLFHIILPACTEPGYRSPLPVWVKFPMIVGVVLFLIAIKRLMHGFVTVFPMVGVIAAYEARYSLWTNARIIPISMLTLVPLMIVCRLTQSRIGLGPALALGWIVFLITLFLLIRSGQREKPDRDAETAFRIAENE